LVRKKKKRAPNKHPLWGETWYNKDDGEEYTGLMVLLRKAIEVCGHKKNQALFLYMKNRWERLHSNVAFPLKNANQVEGHKRHNKDKYADINKNNVVGKRCPTDGYVRIPR